MERKFTRGLNKPGMAAQLRESVSQVVRESAVLVSFVFVNLFASPLLSLSLPCWERLFGKRLCLFLSLLLLLCLCCCCICICSCIFILSSCLFWHSVTLAVTFRCCCCCGRVLLHVGITVIWIEVQFVFPSKYVFWLQSSNFLCHIQSTCLCCNPLLFWQASKLFDSVYDFNILVLSFNTSWEFLLLWRCRVALHKQQQNWHVKAWRARRRGRRRDETRVDFCPAVLCFHRLVYSVVFVSFYISCFCLRLLLRVSYSLDAL